MVVVLCAVLLIVSWVVAVTAKSDLDRQAELVAQANELLKDGIYILAYPLLEEATGFNTPETINIENDLKKVYLMLIDQAGFRRKYIDLLEKQMDRRNAPPDIYIEAAEFFIEGRRFPDAMAALLKGIEKTGDERIFNFYEQERYAFRVNRANYDNVMTGFNSTFQVLCDEGFWGLARLDGSILIPTEYDKISNFSGDRAIAKKDGEIFAVDRNGNRIAKLHANAVDFGSFSSNRVTLLIDGRWHRATGEFEMGAATFEKIGMHVDGNAPAMENGRWGVVNLAAEWVIPAEYDEVIMDELGRAYGQGAVFVRNGNRVNLIVGGEHIGDTYEDARPFGEDYYAAVKKNGLWGFINTSGELVIDYQFEDALSFGQHLAAVKIGEFWGYISIYGNIAIEPEYLQAKNFSSGSAPVLTEAGWRILSLLEFAVAGGLF
jgi:tetratricopeptide (TPR) repeat protein